MLDVSCLQDLLQAGAHAQRRLPGAQGRGRTLEHRLRLVRPCDEEALFTRASAEPEHPTVATVSQNANPAFSDAGYSEK